VSTPTETDLAALRKQVDEHPNWYHQIELAPGLVTPGSHPSAEALKTLDAMGLPRDAKGLRVLDVGCRDGFFAFEMERRGATVTGLDYADPDVTGFGIASRGLGSRVEYVVANVYDLTPDRFGTFDLVLFLGVLYHLRNPLLALDRMRHVMKPGSLVFVETHILSGRGAGASDEPLWRFYPRDELRRDHTNKWAPNLPGLLRALEECQIEVLHAQPSGERAWVRGRAVVENALEYYRVLDSASGMFGRGRG
jgi:tRNA (mo5U34)-methyltransferase